MANMSKNTRTTLKDYAQIIAYTDDKEIPLGKLAEKLGGPMRVRSLIGQLKTRARVSYELLIEAGYSVADIPRWVAREKPRDSTEATEEEGGGLKVPVQPTSTGNTSNLPQPRSGSVVLPPGRSQLGRLPPRLPQLPRSPRRRSI